MSDVVYSIGPLVDDLRIYKFLLKTIRDEDQREGSAFLERYLRGPQSSWATTEQILLSIPELWDIEAIPDRYLKFLKAIVGWTKEPLLKLITDAIDDKALRRLIAASGVIWNEKGPEDTILAVLRNVAPARARIWNWFFYRWVLGTTGLGEEHAAGVDPWMVGLPADGSLDCYRSTLQIVDDGTLDRALVKRVLRLMRALGERFDIVYLKFLDAFDVQDDDTQWDHPSSLALKIAVGLLSLTNTLLSESTFAITSGSSSWAQYLYAARIRGHSNAGNARFGLVFYRTDSTHYYAVLIDTVNQELRVRSVVGGVVTDFTTVNLNAAAVNILPDIFYTLRVSIVVEGATNRILVEVDGAILVSTTNNALSQGSVGLLHDAAATLECSEAYVIGLPAESDSLEINVVP